MSKNLILILKSPLFYSTTSLRRHAANFHECEWNEAQGLSGFKNGTSSEINTFTPAGGNNKSKRSSFNGRALIYELFEKISEKEAQCKICYVVLKITRGSTTDIRHHALRYHESGVYFFIYDITYQCSQLFVYTYFFPSRMASHPTKCKSQ